MVFAHTDDTAKSLDNTASTEVGASLAPQRKTIHVDMDTFTLLSNSRCKILSDRFPQENVQRSVQQSASVGSP